MNYRLLSSIFYSDSEKYEQIYNNRFNSESTYRLNFDINDYKSFVVINHDILQKVDEINKADKTLSNIINNLPDIALAGYTKKCLIDEIKMTNDIEGVYSTRKEIKDILNDKSENNTKKRLYGLVKKYEMLSKQDIKLETCEDIRDLYNELVLKEVLEEDTSNKPDGEIFRKNKVYVQNATGNIIHTGIYPEEKIIESMSKCLNILNNDDFNFKIRIAIFHYIFGYIHPFYDGNGRTSRFISSYLLSKELNFLVAYRLSYTIKNNIQSYYKSFKITNDEKNRGDLTHFVMKFFDILIESINDLCESLIEKLNKLEYFNNIIEKNQCLNKDIKLANILFVLVQNTLFGDHPLSINDLYRINFPSTIGETKIRKCINSLENMNLLIKHKEGKKFIYDVNLQELGK